MAKKPVNSLNLEMIQAIDTSIQNAARPAPDRRASSLLRLGSTRAVLSATFVIRSPWDQTRAAARGGSCHPWDDPDLCFSRHLLRWPRHSGDVLVLCRRPSIRSLSSTAYARLAALRSRRLPMTGTNPTKHASTRSGGRCKRSGVRDCVCVAVALCGRKVPRGLTARHAAYTSTQTTALMRFGCGFTSRG